MRMMNLLLLAKQDNSLGHGESASKIGNYLAS